MCAAIADDDDFFALGGDSLAVAQLGARIQEALGRTVEPRIFFESSTFAAFCGGRMLGHRSVR